MRKCTRRKASKYEKQETSGCSYYIRALNLLRLWNVELLNKQLIIWETCVGSDLSSLGGLIRSNKKNRNNLLIH